VCSETRSEGWKIRTAAGGIASAAFSTLPTYLATQNGPQDVPASGRWVIQTGGGGLKIQPWLQGVDACHAMMHVSFWRQRDVQAPNPNREPMWKRFYAYAVQLEAGAVEEPLLALNDGTAVGGLWRPIDTIGTPTRNALIGGFPLWFLPVAYGGNEAGPAFFDAAGWPIADIFITTNGAAATAATAANLEFTTINGG
jgi:hypothetical protein